MDAEDDLTRAPDEGSFAVVWPLIKESSEAGAVGPVFRLGKGGDRTNDSWLHARRLLHAWPIKKSIIPRVRSG